MKLNELVEPVIVSVRDQNPAYVAVSPDIYSRWQDENGGIEPLAVAGIPIQIRDNYKPGTILILGQRRDQSAQIAL